ncbi:hypothetical protein CYLTODRAFT_362819 [Cylindrobasidium torrendii FP15055 ss-10]|uniref:G-patch domain-containing protein n=1 Tax=Cylindrobasidium torrendii FP15055 ss-10 TaxID=1314674 RepID=A0A0D7AW44_9AGAR|nr:hypothetical protein CYLTODRAFT_362819 [Cylindrobasidium torrendii FP15055 ss-10]
MATTSRFIYSYYDPADRKELEIETGQIPTATPEAELEEAWNTEAARAFKHKKPPAPRFVPASIKDGEWNNKQSASNRQSEPQASTSADATSWYRSLVRDGPSSTSRMPAPAPTPPKSITTTPKPAPPPTSHDPWFIRNAVKSVPQQHPTASTSTLAEILHREPPPKPTDAPFQPPVFLHIGPSNVGFSMLEKYGWNEGEALGPDVRRRKRILLDDEALNRKRKSNTISEELVEVVDLTADSEDESDELQWADTGVKLEDTSALLPDEGSSGRTALVRPIPTFLKTDRLGIGLKAKTTGPYKESRKHITHTAEAIAAHRQSVDEQRRRKMKFGKGKRGLAREHDQERLARQRLLAYMNE